MDIQFTEEQELLRSSVQRLLRDQYDFDTRRKIVASEEGFSRKAWQTFAELGLLAAPFAEEFGGLGGGTLSTMIIMQEFGRHLVVEPFVETVVLAGGLLERVATPEQQQGLIPDIIAGSKIWTLAWTEQGFALRSRRRHHHGAARGQGLCIERREGRRHRGALGGLSDRLGAHVRRSAGIATASACSWSIAEPPISTCRVSRPSTAVAPPRSACVMSGGELLGKEGEGVAALEACRDGAIGALCAEAVGAMGELNSATLEYSKTRKQFGTTIGSFQVLQHRMVDMFIAHQEALSLMQHLTLSLGAG